MRAPPSHVNCRHGLAPENDRPCSNSISSRPFSALKFLLLNQAFYPDVVSTAQHLQTVALELVRRGHEVTVISSRRAYDHPERKFPAVECWRGIHIYRINSTGFGKAAKWRRAVDFGSFILGCAVRILTLPRHDAILALTSPPLISFLGACLSVIQRRRFFYWVMDFNPDEAIAAGWLRPGSPVTRVLEWMSLFSLRRATKIIALDRFMHDRIVAKGIAAEKLVIIPPWSHDDEISFDAEGRARFRQAHGLDGKFVVMYSGNHSPCHPLETLLQAAAGLLDQPEIVFYFVGGGSEFRKIQQRACASGGGTQPGANLRCLPYQPLSELSGSLSAADLHVVVMGEPFVGLVHPCKIYNILAVGSPVLCIAPRPSHLSELLDSLGDHAHAIVSHGDVVQVRAAIVRMREQMRNHRARRPAPTGLSHRQESALPKFVGILESR